MHSRKILTGKTELSMKKHVENRNALTRTTSLTVNWLLSRSISFASAGIESWSLSFGPMANNFKKFAYNQLAAAWSMLTLLT